MSEQQQQQQRSITSGDVAASAAAPPPKATGRRRTTTTMRTAAEQLPASLTTDLHRLGKSVHGHDGTSRIVMVRKTDQRTFASIRNGEEPKLETITRETIETFRGQRTQCKITTEKKKAVVAAVTTAVDIRRQKQGGVGTFQDRFEIDFLRTHNEYRARHGAPPLKLDRKLCKYSEEWARILAAKNHPEHRRNSPYGENIYCVFTTSENREAIAGRAPVDAWYEEMRRHPFGREPHDLRSGHFTQVVWRTSELLGVGVARSRQGYVYVVANYSPAGNFLGHFAENVPALLRPGGELVDGDGGDVEIDFDQFALDALKVHNEYRRRHGVPDLKLSEELCDYAKEWADHCSKTGNMAHRPNNAHGENIFYGYSSDFSHTPSARDVVKKWYDEIRDHAFASASTSTAAAESPINYASLHFSQVVWRASVELGVGLAKNGKGRTYVVANYEPRGNVVGQYAANVPKPRH